MLRMPGSTELGRSEEHTQELASDGGMIFVLMILFFV